MKTLEELAAIMERVEPTLRVVMPLIAKVPATLRPFFHRALTGYQEQTTAMFDRHLALCNAVEFLLTMKFDDNTLEWKDANGQVWEPEPDIKFLMEETQVRMLRAAAAPVRPS